MPRGHAQGGGQAKKAARRRGVCVVALDRGGSLHLTHAPAHPCTHAPTAFPAQVARGREIHEYNKQFKIISAEEARVQAEQDAILLNYALHKEREKEAEEKAKREGAREAARTYKKYLEEQMIKEAEDNSWIDEVRKREEERVWKARDDALQAREDARAYLMKAVDEGRQEQIR